jgi:hypothetical protein
LKQPQPRKRANSRHGFQKCRKKLVPNPLNKIYKQAAAIPYLSKIQRPLYIVSLSNCFLFLGFSFHGCSSSLILILLYLLVLFLALYYPILQSSMNCFLIFLYAPPIYAAFSLILIFD